MSLSNKPENIKSSLLSSIQAGPKLKPMVVDTSLPLVSGNNKGSLLDAIKEGPKLKKVSQTENQTAAASVSRAPAGLGAFANSGINDILARRKYIEADESDDSESDDSEWDE
jgi:hypothetical protein